MKHRIIGALTLILLCLLSVSAATETITFDGNDTLSIRTTSKNMTGVVTDCGGNNCVRGVATSGRSNQWAGVIIEFPDTVRIQSLTFDYTLSVNGTEAGYTGGVWNITIRSGNTYTFSGTMKTNVIATDSWRTVSTLDADKFSSTWDSFLPIRADYILIELRPNNSQHTGAIVQLDNIVIEHEN